MALEDICEIFTTRSIFGCTGHHTPLGYEYVARSIYSYLEEHGIRPGTDRASSESFAVPDAGHRI